MPSNLCASQAFRGDKHYFILYIKVVVSNMGHEWEIYWVNVKGSHCDVCTPVAACCCPKQWLPFELEGETVYKLLAVATGTDACR